MLARAGETAVEVQLVGPTANIEHGERGGALTGECDMSVREFSLRPVASVTLTARAVRRRPGCRAWAAARDTASPSDAARVENGASPIYENLRTCLCQTGATCYLRFILRGGGDEDQRLQFEM